MSDLRAIGFLVAFSIIFVGLLGMIGPYVDAGGEYIPPENVSQYEGEPGVVPSVSIFQTLYQAFQLSTGVWILDNWFLPIAGIMCLFILYRAIRGQ